MRSAVTLFGCEREQEAYTIMHRDEMEEELKGTIGGR